MKLVKCRKCGTAVMTDDSLLEIMVEEMNECNRKARKAKNSLSRGSYMQQSKQIGKMIIQIQHRTTEMDLRAATKGNYLKFLINFVLENEFATAEQLESLAAKAEKEAEIKNQKDLEEINRIYGSFRNDMVNRTNKDTTAKKAIKNMK